MPLMFEGGAPGRVIALVDPGVAPGRTRLVRSDPELATFDDHLSIITRAVVSERTNHQVLHTLGGEINLYVFGDRIGRMTLSGLCFPESCGTNPDGSITVSLSTGEQLGGLELMLRNYRQNRLSVRRQPIIVAIGTIAIEAFLEGVDIATLDPESQLATFNLQLMTVPERLEA